MADLIKPNHPHGPLLRQFSADSGLLLSSEQMLSNNSFTFISEMRLGVTSWLDHCVSTQDGHNIISNMYIDYELSFRDHIPLVMKLNLDQLPSVENDINNVAPRLDWENIDPIKLREFTLMTELYMSNLTIPDEVLKCRDPNCTNQSHIKLLNELYVKMCKCLTDARNFMFGVKGKRSFDIKPGLNEHVKELRNIARKRFVAWREAGQ